MIWIPQKSTQIKMDDCIFYSLSVKSEEDQLL